jgi:hypothetical protein
MPGSFREAIRKRDNKNREEIKQKHLHGVPRADPIYVTKRTQNATSKSSKRNIHRAIKKPSTRPVGKNKKSSAKSVKNKKSKSFSPTKSKAISSKSDQVNNDPAKNLLLTEKSSKSGDSFESPPQNVTSEISWTTLAIWAGCVISVLLVIGVLVWLLRKRAAAARIVEAKRRLGIPTSPTPIRPLTPLVSTPVGGMSTTRETLNPTKIDTSDASASSLRFLSTGGPSPANNDLV